VTPKGPVQPVDIGLLRAVAVQEPYNIPTDHSCRHSDVPADKAQPVHTLCPDGGATSNQAGYAPCRDLFRECNHDDKCLKSRLRLELDGHLYMGEDQLWVDPYGEPNRPDVLVIG